MFASWAYNGNDCQGQMHHAEIKKRVFIKLGTGASLTELCWLLLPMNFCDENVYG